MTFAEKILEFDKKLSNKIINLPDGFEIINPFIGEQKDKIKKITDVFYKKYYNDNNLRYMILGSSPARRGTAVTGIPFEDAERLEIETGIKIENFSINKSSSNFIYDVITKCGGFQKFYNKFYMNFICPFGIIKVNTNGKKTNCNYYENKNLENALYSFIIDTLNDQINIGINKTKCYCIGSGENYDFLSRINAKYNFFDKIIPLKHPRFIMQYNSKNKEMFIKEYVNNFNEVINENL